MPYYDSNIPYHHHHLEQLHKLLFHSLLCFHYIANSGTRESMIKIVTQRKLSRYGVQKLSARLFNTHLLALTMCQHIQSTRSCNAATTLRQRANRYTQICLTSIQPEHFPQSFQPRRQFHSRAHYCWLAGYPLNSDTLLKTFNRMPKMLYKGPPAFLATIASRRSTIIASWDKNTVSVAELGSCEPCAWTIIYQTR